MAGLKEYRIQRRFEVWVEMPVKASSIESALEMAKHSTFDDFLKTKPKVDLNDFDTLDGLSVSESW